MPSNFSARLRASLASGRAARGLLMRPQLVRMPLPILKEDDPFLPWGKAIIAATREVACCYVFDLAAYLALGAAGAVALERTIAYARAGGDVVTVLHGPFATLDYLAAAGDSGFNADGVTVANERLRSAYAEQHGDGAFVVMSDLEAEAAPVSAYSGCLLRIVLEGRQALPVAIYGSEALYASPREDFAEAVRAVLVRG